MPLIEWQEIGGTRFALRNSLTGVLSLGLDLPRDLGDVFFKADEVNTPMLIMMTPKYLTPKQLQELYLDQVSDMSIRIGPLVTNSERESTRVEIGKTDYTEHSTLMSAPILFQTMVRKTVKCPFNYSLVFIEKMHQKALADKCNLAIYKCGDSVGEVESIISCMGEGEETAMFFGLSQTSLNGKPAKQVKSGSFLTL